MEVEAPSLLFRILTFAVALSVLVFVHEWGHYIVARIFKVRVEVFSIGFGREIFGFTDKHGTRWKFSWLPLGGYVKFFGDASGASNPSEAVAEMTPEERAVSFHHKSVGKRAAIVAAGPGINFLFAIVVYAGLYMTLGQPFNRAEIEAVMPDSAAQEAGLQQGDVIVSVDGRPIERFEELIRAVSINPGIAMTLGVDRAGQVFDVELVPTVRVQEDRFGNQYRSGFLGVQRVAGAELRQMGFFDAVVTATKDTGEAVRTMLVVVGQVIMGVRTIDDLGGPLKIAKITGEQASLGLVPFISFLALISINLGLVNLFPIPMLDGGHLMFYGFEALKGSPVSLRLQELGYMVGFALVIGLMLLLTWNDLTSL